jgi:scyllo-inositol 2-dehydrogenase (NADP+)
MASASTEGPIRTAIAGLGRAGWGIHARTVQYRTDFKIVSVVDPEPERLKEAETTFPGCRVHQNWKSFLKNPNDAELIVIATTSNTHCPMSLQALKSGLHVLVEKPMALNVQEADRMIAAAKKARRILTVHQNRRTDAELHHLVSIINSGILGRVFMIKQLTSSFSRRNDWQTLRKFGGGTLNNTCPHTIDQCLFLLQSPVQDVWGDLQAVVTAGDAEDHVKIMIRGKSGRVIDMEVSDACAVKQPHWLVMGTLGTLVSEDKDFVIKYLNPDKLPELKVNPTPAVPRRKYGVIGGETLEWLEKRVPAGPAEFQVNFYDRLFASIRGKEKLFVTPESIREQIRVIELARKGTKFK